MQTKAQKIYEVNRLTGKKALMSEKRLVRVILALANGKRKPRNLPSIFFTALRFALYHSSQNSLPFRPTVMIEMSFFIVGVGISSLFPVKPVLAIRWLVWRLFARRSTYVMRAVADKRQLEDTSAVFFIHFLFFLKSVFDITAIWG